MMLRWKIQALRPQGNRSTSVNRSPFLQPMQTVLRLFALVALALTLPACATSKPKSSCCSSSGKCAPGDASCHAPAAKKKAS